MKPMRTAVGYFQNSSAGIAKLIPCASRMDSEVIPIRFPCASNSPPPDEPRELSAAPACDVAIGQRQLVRNGDGRAVMGNSLRIELVALDALDPVDRTRCLIEQLLGRRGCLRGERLGHLRPTTPRDGVRDADA